MDLLFVMLTIRRVVQLAVRVRGAARVSMFVGKLAVARLTLAASTPFEGALRLILAICA